MSKQQKNQLDADDDLLPVVDDLSPTDTVAESDAPAEDFELPADDDFELPGDDESPYPSTGDLFEESATDNPLPDISTAEEDITWVEEGSALTAEDEEESLLLPDTELEDILENSDSSFFEDLPADPAAPSTDATTATEAIPANSPEPVAADELPLPDELTEETQSPEDFENMDDWAKSFDDAGEKEAGKEETQETANSASDMEEDMDGWTQSLDEAGGETVAPEESPVQEEEDGPVALSEDELENILSDVDAEIEDGHEEELPEELAPPPPVEELSTEPEDDTFADDTFAIEEQQPEESEDDAFIIDEQPAEPEDDAFAMEEQPVAATDVIAEEEPDELFEEEGLDILEEDETIFIFDDDEVADEMTNEENAPLPEETEGVDDLVAAGATDSEPVEEDITLSEEELDKVLLDTEDMPEGKTDAALIVAEADNAFTEDSQLFEDQISDTLEEAGHPAQLHEEELSDEEEFSAEPESPEGDALGLSDDDDESITLTLEELGNIVSDVETAEEEAPPIDEAPPIEEELEDEGPVALSDSELDAILEDVGEPEEVLGEGEELSSDEVSQIMGEEEEPASDYDEEIYDLEQELPKEPVAAAVGAPGASVEQKDLKKMISYLDGLFDQLPDETVRNFSKSEYFDLYRKIMSDLGLS